MPEEVQKHGFTWQNQILKNIYRVTEDELSLISYTAKDDLPANLNRLDNAILSLKTTGNDNTVCMGDFLSFYKTIASGEKIHIVVLVYKQIGEYKCLKKLIEINLTGCLELLFGDLNLSDIEELDKVVKDIPHGKRKQSEKLNTKLLNKKLRDKCACIIPNVKADSKKQRRLQCSFNKFQDFIKNNPEIIISQSITNQFRGGSIESKILSKSRSFNH